jgi:MFS family permease
MRASSARKLALAPNGIPARIVLAILTSAGILYANVAPVIVSGLALRPGFDAESAGYVYSANMYGTSIGGFAIVFLVQRLRWRAAAAMLLGLLVAADLLSAWFDAAAALYGIRFVHGLVGGALIGVGLAVIGRTESPERTIAFMLVVQLSLGGVGVAVLAPLVATLSVSVVWLSLVAFSVLALLLLPLLDDYPVNADRAHVAGSVARAPWLPIVLALVSLFCYQAGQMAAFAYMIELGNHYLFDAGFISLAIAMSLWIGGPAALLVAWWSTRSGRLRPVCLGILFTTGAFALLLVPEPSTFLVANIGYGVFFSLTIPYLFGVASEMDNTGQMAAFAGFVSSVGLASGPALAGMILGDAHFERLILLSIVMLCGSVALSIGPARLLDLKSKRGRATW